ncbi:MAG TPA: hypothetical protein PK323_14020 [Bacteroidia bacterium]|nr:hypothetical protein [Bacteroidia bacterium]
MKFKLLLAALLFGSIVYGQNGTADAKVQAALCKDWKIVAYEMFGTVNQLEDNEVNDHILLNKDFTCTIVEHGVTTTGKWSTNGNMAYIAVLPSNSKNRRVYNVSANTGNEIKLNYQDSVLVKRIYHLKAK